MRKYVLLHLTTIYGFCSVDSAVRLFLLRLVQMITQ